MDLFWLCIKVFGVRILDVSMGTFRTIVTVKGRKLLASLIGFVEVFIWFVVVKEALNTSSDSIMIAFSYAGGFATGTYIGTYLSERFIKGNFGVQVVLSNTNDLVVKKIREEGYALSVIDVKGEHNTKDKYMLFIEIKNSKLEHLKRLIKSLDEKAFIVVNETKQVYNGYFTK